MNLLHHALVYAGFGWQIHPCNLDKTPKLKNWPSLATTDRDTITSWWAKWPDASIGCVTGTPSGIWVLDIDYPEGLQHESSLNLPRTLIQQTGGGGKQYFYAIDGHDIRNSAGKIAHRIDVRGNGGYTILPPSLHPEGRKYRWLTRHRIIPAPKELIERITEDHHNGWDRVPTSSRYVEQAIRNEERNILLATKGNRNDTLVKAAFNLGQLVAGGEVPHDTIYTTLANAARHIGLPDKEIHRTLTSGLSAANTSPRTVKNIAVYEAEATPISRMLEDIRNFCTHNTGSFTINDLDRELNIPPSTENKRSRNQCLELLAKEKVVTRSKNRAGKWRILAVPDIQWIDFKDKNIKYFDIELPLNLGRMVNINEKNVIVIAGSFNSGKTTLLMEILRQNLYTPHKKVFMISDMGAKEYQNKVAKVHHDLDEWNERIHATAISAGFAGVIAQTNPDGINVIDYLEEPEGDFTMVTQSIRDIWDVLDKGIAIIALQKKMGAIVGRGGEGTAEKARLYLSMDRLVNTPDGVITAVSVIKAKDTDNAAFNPNGTECHIKITQGNTIQVIRDWEYISSYQRNQLIYQYKQESTQSRYGGRLQ